jgi:GNAT superfamily N-acetyltransferase
MSDTITIRPATASDVPTILGFIRGLAKYERLEDACVATEESLAATLFGARAYAEVVFACIDGTPVGFALFFHNYSTFLAQPGIYLEDLFVRPSHRGAGIGTAMLTRLARLAVERGHGRFEWSVLDWNEPAIRFYRAIGAVAMDEWVRYRLTGQALEDFAAGVPKAPDAAA